MRSYARLFVPYLLIAALACESAWAAPEASETPLGQALHGAAKAAYRSAELLFNSGDYRGAIAKYEEAYDLSKDPRLLFDMALAEKSLHAYAAMQSLLERYEREVGTHITPEDKSAVDAALQAIHNLVGSLALTVNVPGAEVRIDDHVVGTSPLPAPVTLDLGTHKVRIVKDGYKEFATQLDVPGGGSVEQRIDLTPETHMAQLLVVADSDDAIAIDGKPVARGRYDAAMAARTHELLVTAPGKTPYQATIDLRDGQTRTVQVTLATEKKSGPVWPWVLGGLAAVAGASVGAYFLFRPHDETNGVPNAPLFNAKFSFQRGM